MEANFFHQSRSTEIMQRRIFHIICRIERNIDYLIKFNESKNLKVEVILFAVVMKQLMDEQLDTSNPEHGSYIVTAANAHTRGTLFGKKSKIYH